MYKLIKQKKTINKHFFGNDDYIQIYKQQATYRKKKYYKRQIVRVFF